MQELAPAEFSGQLEWVIKRVLGKMQHGQDCRMHQYHSRGKVSDATLRCHSCSRLLIPRITVPVASRFRKKSERLRDAVNADFATLKAHHLTI